MISFEQFRPLIGSNRISILLHWSLALGRFIVNFTLLKFRTHIVHNLFPIKEIQRLVLLLIFQKNTFKMYKTESSIFKRCRFSIIQQTYKVLHRLVPDSILQIILSWHHNILCSCLSLTVPAHYVTPHNSSYFG